MNMQQIKNIFHNITLDGVKTGVTRWVSDHFGRISADTLGWVAVIMIHFATIPTLLSASAGLTDQMPPVDIVLFAWAGLFLMFCRAAIMKDLLNLVTIGVGFMLQASIMALMLFK